jgi:uncharacterized metal-binding protein/predicted Fe-Mo cluster-binding NifX family protein
MRYGIALLGDRVAPRSTCADKLVVVAYRRNRARAEGSSTLSVPGLLELAKVLADNHVDILVCGGISREESDYLKGRRIRIIDNVVASGDELLEAISAGRLCSGFGMNGLQEASVDLEPDAIMSPQGPSERRDGERREADDRPADCLACRHQVCREGRVCDAMERFGSPTRTDRETARIMDTALDISFENERTLCRLSELIYFCLEMRYERLGLAYCVDLEEPADILTRVLRRFFTVFPVCCKVGGEVIADPLIVPPASNPRISGRRVSCNPEGQANVLNSLNTHLNIQVGLCMGADCVFTRFSDAPVTTLFVKDRSLANNPIGAVYSDYYIEEAIQSSRGVR